MEKLRHELKDEHFFVVNKPSSKGVGIFLNSYKSILEFSKLCKTQYFNDGSAEAINLESSPDGVIDSLVKCGIAFFNKKGLKNG